MIRLLFTIIAGVLLGGIVHLVSVLALPRIATQDAYSRLTPMTKLNAVTPLPLADPNNAPMPFMDPAFAHGDLPLRSVRRLDQARRSRSARPIPRCRSIPATKSPTTPSTTAPPARKVIELDLMTEAQHDELPEDEDVTAADRLIIDSPTATGLIVLKALAPEPGLMPQAQASLAASSCKVQTDPPAKQAERARATKRCWRPTSAGAVRALRRSGSARNRPDRGC